MAVTPRKSAVILVGHGAVPRDFPAEQVARLKILERERRRSESLRTDEEAELDERIRNWPRTTHTDPYRAGLERLAEELRMHLNGVLFDVAYNEFCGPTIEDSIERLILAGATEIIVVPSMLTPGGVHAEVDIPAALEDGRHLFPGIEIRYAWPVDLELLAGMLVRHIQPLLRTPPR